MISAFLFVLKNKIDDWAFPDFGEYEYYVGKPHKSLLISYDLKGGVLEPVQVLNLEAYGVIRYRRSWLLPWRKYEYVVLSLGRSPYHYLVKTPRFIGMDGNYIGEWDTAEMIRETLVKAVQEPWFTVNGELGDTHR